MFEMPFTLAQAAPTAQGGIGGTLVMVGLMFLVFYFIAWRPEAKKNSEHAKFLNALKVGDEVVTTGGLVGKVTEVDTDFITLEISKGYKVRVIRKLIQGSPQNVLAQFAGPGQPAAKSGKGN